MEPGFEMDEERLIPRPRQIYGSFYIRMGAVRKKLRQKL